MTNSEIKNCSATGNVVGVNQIGGFTGTAWDNSLITNSYSEGTVAGDYIVGGFSGFSTFAFGANRLNTIENSYSRSNVTVISQMIGGFYGYTQSNAVLKNVYSTGTVEVVESTGGFIGAVGNLVIENGHFDKTIAPHEAIGKFDFDPLTFDIVGRNTADMKTEAFKTILNKGNATGVWSINPAINDGYPYLNTQPMLAVNDIKNNLDVSVAPTFADTTLNILSSEKSLTYEIVDMTGRTLKKNTISGTQKTLNISDLQKGNYLLILKSETSGKTIKFIKK